MKKRHITQDNRWAECLYCLIPLSATSRKQAEQNARLQERIKELTARVAWLNRQLFGRKSEKLRTCAPTCLTFLPKNLPVSSTWRRKSATRPWNRSKRKRRKSGSRSVRTAKWWRICPYSNRGHRTGRCGPVLYRRIGEKITRIVRHKPGMFYVKEIIRPQYALKDNTQLPPKGQKVVEIAPCR